MTIIYLFTKTNLASNDFTIMIHIKASDVLCCVKLLFIRILIHIENHIKFITVLNKLGPFLEGLV